ncbi:protein TIFY 8-like isoform X2 [Musa acuminata AAA Group]|uniref:protein TIFY 8-like isoform X2 n=1 Tax=Musa acuminata AAA Group TaxID=214697 RepID=UPI0031DAECF3
MGGDESSPVFHDFLGMSYGGASFPAARWTKGTGIRTLPGKAEASGSGSASASVGVSSIGHRLISGSVDLGSEMQGVSNSEVSQHEGTEIAPSGLELGNTTGRKRNHFDSSYMGSMKDAVLPMGSGSLESSNATKMLGKEVINEQLGRANDVEMMMSSMQPPIRPTKQIVHQTSHYGIRMYLDNIPSYACKYSTLGGAIISQSAADEGSRTGIRGSGVMNVLGHNRSSQTTEPKSYYHVPRNRATACVSRQMTIFYAGRAHVFDDVHPNKADVIMALAGSSGGSWSTTYSTAMNKAKVLGRDDTQKANVLLSNGGDRNHLLGQVTQTPVADPLSGHISDRRGGVATRDGNLMARAAEPNTEGKWMS